MGEVQQTRIKCFGKNYLCQLRDRVMSTAQHTTVPLKEELGVTHRCKDGVEEIVGILRGYDLRESNKHGDIGKR